MVLKTPLAPRGVTSALCLATILTILIMLMTSLTLTRHSGTPAEAAFPTSRTPYPRSRLRAQRSDVKSLNLGARSGPALGRGEGGSNDCRDPYSHPGVGTYLVPR